MNPAPIRLTYDEPVLRNRQIVFERFEKKLQSTSWTEARSEAAAFLRGGVIIFGGDTHRPKEVSFAQGHFLPGTEKIHEEFFNKPYNPNHPLTPLQKRMQSGGA